MSEGKTEKKESNKLNDCKCGSNHMKSSASCIRMLRKIKRVKLFECLISGFSHNSFWGRFKIKIINCDGYFDLIK